LFQGEECFENEYWKKKTILSAKFVTLTKPIEMCFLIFNLEALIMADNDEGMPSHDS